MFLNWVKSIVRSPWWSVVVWSLIGFCFAVIIFAKVLDVMDSFSLKVEVGQDVATLVAIMGEPTEKYSEPEMVDGTYVDGANVLVYHYKMPALSAGDITVNLKNGKVVSISAPK